MSDPHARLLDLIYDAAVSPELWTDVLIGVSDHVGAGPISLTSLDITSGEGVGIAARNDPALIELYIEHYVSTNPILIVDSPESYCQNWRLEVLTDEEMIERSILLKSEYYNDFLLPSGSERIVAVRLSLQGRRLASMTMGRGSDRGAFSPAEVGALRRLQPHLVRSFRLAERLAASSFRPDALLDVEAFSRDAIMLVDASGVILFKNSTAENLLGQNAGLRSVHGLLGAVRPEENATLQRLIGLANSSNAEVRSGGSVALMQTGAEPLPVFVSPLKSTVPSTFSRPSVALLVVKMPEPARQLASALLRQHLRLTESEVRLTRALFEGLTLEDAAARLGVSRHTVRAQLGSIFVKTGTHRQAELVRMLSQFSLPPGA